MPGFRRRRTASPAPVPARADTVPAAYAALPYPTRPAPQTHPRRLAAEALLHGLKPARVDRCSVLELGCGNGGNLLPMAAALPGASFVGVDSDVAAIETARRRASAVDLVNARFQSVDLATADAGELGRHDYVIAHGVLSWVSPAARQRLPALIAACLNRDGVAFVSFNQLPGGRVRQLVRDVLLEADDPAATPAERLARARLVLKDLRALPAFDGFLDRHLQRTGEKDDGVLFHDELSPENHMFALRELAAIAERAGLRWFSDAHLGDSSLGPGGDAVRARLDAVDDRLDREVLLSTVTLRPYREALLCTAGRAPEPWPDARAVASLLVRSQASAKPKRKGAETTFATPTGARVSTGHPALVAAFEAVAAAWPAAVPAADVAGGDELVHAALLRAHAADVVRLEAPPAPALVTAASARPRLSALNRMLAAEGDDLVTAWHEPLRPTDDVSRTLMTLLDGERDHAAVVSALPPAAKANTAGVAAALGDLASKGLLEA